MCVTAPRAASFRRAAPLLALLAHPACASLTLGPGTPTAAVREFPTPGQRATLAARLDRHLDSVESAFRSGDQAEHARRTLELLLYSRSIPIFYLDAHGPALSRRLDAGGVEPHLSFYLDYGRRLSCLGTADARRKLKALAALLRRPPERFGRQAVFLRETCAARSAFRPFTDNVGWATAALFYSDFGQEVTRHYAPDLPRLFGLVQTADACGSCGDDGTIGVGGVGRAARAMEGESACPAIGAGMAAGMDGAAETTFCRATTDLGGHGFGGAGAACLRVARDLNEAAGFPPVTDSIDSFERFAAFIGCKGRQFGQHNPHPFYDDLTKYFDGGTALERKYGEKVREEDGRTTRRAPSFAGADPAKHGRETTYETGNPSHVYSVESFEIKDGQQGSTSYHGVEYDYEHGTLQDSTYLATAEGTFGRVTSRDAEGNWDTSYTKDGKEITEEEYEAAQKKYFPGDPAVDPSPEDPRSPCDPILDQGRPPISRADNGPLIQYGPDDVVVRLLEPLRECLASFDSTRQCSTLLRCADDPATDVCGCRAFSPGTPGQTSQCPHIQCDGDAAIVNCMCVRSDGSMIPGRGGPLLGWPLPPLEVSGPGRPRR